jgi:hypothetical protein
MPIPSVRLGELEVSRFIIGGNPFSGFSHQSRERSAEMVAWYTDERIVETLFQAEALGVTACILRGDDHITRVLRRYWDEGGRMAWIAQTNSRGGTPVESAVYCRDRGASACFLHGGVADHLVAQGRPEEMATLVKAVQAMGMPAGVAGHMPEVFRWAEAHVSVDFYMLCYYNPSPRQDVPHHDPAAAERYLVEDREARVGLVPGLGRPVIHYKVLAAGRTPAPEALSYAAEHMRDGDAVCVGVYTADDPDMLATDIRMLVENLARVGQPSSGSFE